MAVQWEHIQQRPFTQFRHIHQYSGIFWRNQAYSGILTTLCNPSMLEP